MISSICDSLYSPWSSVCTTVFVTYEERFWDVLLITAPFLFFLLLWSTLRTLRLIFHQNRGVRGAYRGEHYADRFIDVWYATTPPASNSQPYNFGGNGSVHSLSQIDHILEKRGLVAIDHGHVQAIRNIRNRVTAFVCEKILIYVYGDHKNQFRMMKQAYKNSVKRR